MSSFDDVIATFDWSNIRSFSDRSERIPKAMRELETAKNESDSAHAGHYLEMTILNDGCLSEACLPVAACLVAGLPSATHFGRGQALDLLAQIAAGNVYGPQHEQIGAIDPQACVRAVALGFNFYCEILEFGSSYNEKLVCVDLISICGYSDIGLLPRALEILRLARRWPALQSAAPLIDSSLADLASAEH